MIFVTSGACIVSLYKNKDMMAFSEFLAMTRVLQCSNHCSWVVVWGSQDNVEFTIAYSDRCYVWMFCMCVSGWNAGYYN